MHNSLTAPLLDTATSARRSGRNFGAATTPSAFLISLASVSLGVFGLFNSTGHVEAHRLVASIVIATCAAALYHPALREWLGLAAQIATPTSSVPAEPTDSLLVFSVNGVEQPQTRV